MGQTNLLINTHMNSLQLRLFIDHLVSCEFSVSFGTLRMCGWGHESCIDECVRAFFLNF